MISIINLAKELNCNPLVLNKALLACDIFIKTEFGINDGFVDSEICNSIIDHYYQYQKRLLSAEYIHTNKQSFLPVINVPCVYFLFNDNELVYIGQSVQLLGRIQQHIQDKKVFNRVFYEPVERKLLLTVESFYIYRDKPKYNSVGDKEENFINNLIRASV